MVVISGTDSKLISLSSSPKLNETVRTRGFVHFSLSIMAAKAMPVFISI
jgi:hypothetical protein